MKVKMLSAGIAPVRWVNGRPLYLLLRVYNHWDFPKGVVEPGEEPLAAACRELEEETGITEISFPWGRDFYETEPYGAGKVARYYVALTQVEQVELPVSPELGKPEHHEFRWVDYGEGLSLLGERLRPVLEWAHRVTCPGNDGEI